MTNGRGLKANLIWSSTKAKFYQLIASLFVVFPLTKLYLESDFKCKKKDINTDENIYLCISIEFDFFRV